MPNFKHNKWVPRTGRSIEEVVVRRKLDGTDPNSWPDASRSGTVAPENQSQIQDRDHSASRNQADSAGPEALSSLMRRSMPEFSSTYSSSGRASTARGSSSSRVRRRMNEATKDR